MFFAFLSFANNRIQISIFPSKLSNHYIKSGVRMSRVKYSPTFVVQSAQSMRSRMSNAHKQLWANLANGFTNVRFRRQHPIGNHVVDFYCRKHRIIVETGAYGNHKERDIYLRACGYTVLRFTESEVKNNSELVIKCIANTIKRAEIKTTMASIVQNIGNKIQLAAAICFPKRVFKAEPGFVSVQ
jgi:very-short-patch-repair endonuclease